MVNNLYEWDCYHHIGTYYTLSVIDTFATILLCRCIEKEINFGCAKNLATGMQHHQRTSFSNQIYFEGGYNITWRIISKTKLQLRMLTSNFIYFYLTFWKTYIWRGDNLHGQGKYVFSFVIEVWNTMTECCLIMRLNWFIAKTILCYL